MSINKNEHRSLNPDHGVLTLSSDILLKQPAVLGWPLCSGMLAATALLVQEANKLTLKQQLTTPVPQSVITFMDQRGHYWLLNLKKT